MFFFTFAQWDFFFHRSLGYKSNARLLQIQRQGWKPQGKDKTKSCTKFFSEGLFYFVKMQVHRKWEHLFQNGLNLIVESFFFSPFSGCIVDNAFLVFFPLYIDRIILTARN